MLKMVKKTTIKMYYVNSMKLNYAIGGGYEMKKDDDLSLATPACKEKLKMNSN